MGASIVSVIATSSGAAGAYLRTSLGNVRIGFFLTLATVSGALAGAGLAGVVPVRWLQLLLGVALAYSAFTTLRRQYSLIAAAILAMLCVSLALAGGG